MNSFGSSSCQLQDRINRMNAWKDQQRRADEEFVRKQKIRMFINDCDEIRPSLRNLLLKDSKLCQLEQIKDRSKQQQMMKDFDRAWHEVQSRSHKEGTEHENFIAQCRRRQCLGIQDFLKQQMADKGEHDLKVWDEITEERKQVAKLCKEEFQKDQELLRYEKNVQKFVGECLTRQMRENYDTRKQKLDRELKCDQAINVQIRRELEKQQKNEQNEKDQFRRDVFGYLDHLMETRHHNKVVEREKEKLINDIQVKAAEKDWQDCCEFKQKRVLVNKKARLGQVEQIKRNEKALIEEAAKQKNENFIFNERESMERQKIKEAQWQQRLKAYHYGRELMEQRKSEKFRDLAEKQRLNESLLLAAKECQKHEAMGQEFVKSYQDVLPLHPNLLIIQQGKKN